MASEKNAIGHCRRCGFEYPLRKLRTESQPNKEDIRVCRSCFDPYNVRDDADQYTNKVEDMSIERPEFVSQFSSMFAWEPVGNLPPVVVSTKYFWL